MITVSQTRSKETPQHKDGCKTYSRGNCYTYSNSATLDVPAQEMAVAPDKLINSLQVGADVTTVGKPRVAISEDNLNNGLVAAALAVASFQRF